MYGIQWDLARRSSLVRGPPRLSAVDTVQPDPPVHLVQGLPQVDKLGRGCTTLARMPSPLLGRGCVARRPSRQAAPG